MHEESTPSSRVCHSSPSCLPLMTTVTGPSDHHHGLPQTAGLTQSRGGVSVCDSTHCLTIYRQHLIVFLNGALLSCQAAGKHFVDLDRYNERGPLDLAVSEAGPDSWILPPCPCFLHTAPGMALPPSLCLLTQGPGIIGLALLRFLLPGGPASCQGRLPLCTVFDPQQSHRPRSLRSRRSLQLRLEMQRIHSRDRQDLMDLGSVGIYLHMDPVRPYGDLAGRCLVPVDGVAFGQCDYWLELLIVVLLPQCALQCQGPTVVRK
ncbi:hypothetical protein EYF80_014177 [Liparis tanakae]|uniref:Uncharacterized protein n=1 Tax=Liparis tanakae TaxID=230148 RepID=A0A4Z2ICK1_9TELE|nr:hypothetical protein EYF80_014177 [Liparis tanakae]